MVTDSGGLQKEAYIMHKNVITLRNETEWVETMKGNHNILCSIECDKIMEAIRRTDIDANFDDSMYGDGHVAEKLCEILFKRAEQEENI